ncbi:UNVERIFIED_CONTAM: hypothetical protein PYX00_007301 [Menopon gallinae]|uniref:Uncharacterized protein n=1 Tax=Menopon gallinae TaxID=328185 RepID=A0AAW2HJG2_9NEOP
MSNFKFKVPELPEDTLARRKASNIQFRSEKNASANESSNDYCRPTSSRFTRQSGVFNSFSLRNCNTFQPIREYIQEDHAQPSTSRQNNVLSDRSNNSNMIEGPFGQFGNQTCFENTFQSRYNYHNVRGCNRDSTSNYNQMDCFNCGSKPFRDMNFSASHNNTSVFKSNVNNSLCFNNQGLRGMNSSVYAEPQNCTSVNNFHQPSFLRENQSVFGRSLLSGRGRIVQSNVSVNDTRNRISFRQNAHETLNGSSVLRSDNMFNINANNSVADLPSVMKSFLQISNISMKEEILNKFESYGQKLLRMAPDLGTSFFGFAKEVESILEKNTKFRGTTETLLSTLICTPRDCQEKTIFKNEKPPETKVMPKNILSAIKSKNKTNNLQFITSFTTEKKRNETDEFDSELDFNPTPDKKSSSKDEINLKDWYPVAVADGLAFFGKNDENVAFETAVMKKRISNRKVLLTDGRVCNLVGNPSKAQNYPPHITTRIKDGLNTRWKKLVDIIGNFQKTLQKEKGRTRAAEVAERDISINTPLRSNAKEVSKVVKTGTKIEIKSSNVSSKERDKSGDRKSEKPARKTAAPQKNSTTEESKKNASEDEENKEEKSRVLGTTRSGRIVKRPSVLWIGDSFNKTYVGSNSSANSKNKQKSDSPKSENETESPSLKRKRGAPKAPDVQAKKSKPEPQTKQSTKTEKVIHFFTKYCQRTNP